ncbi:MULTISPECIES: class E sortase [Thermocrispum]|nr:MULTISPECIES: class E sortase [Thermocrispum]
MGRPSLGVWYRVLRTVGELLITAGVVVLLFVVYALYVTGFQTAERQRSAEAELDRAFAAAAAQRQRPALIRGKPFARLYVPAFGTDYRFAVVEGVGRDELAVGPGHYPHSALPGEPGNVAIAGHRVGRGAPFRWVDELRSCDAIVLETSRDFLVYRVLPMAGEHASWEQRRRTDPHCAQVPSLADDREYRQVLGRKVVAPDRSDAVAAVPYRADSTLPIAQRKALLTLTTSHPEYDNSQRLVIHAVLTNQFSKDVADRDDQHGPAGYPRVLRQIGGR